MKSDSFDVRNPFCFTDDSERIRYNSFVIREYFISDLRFCMDSLYFDQAEVILEGLKDLVHENIEIKRRNRMRVDEEIEFLIDLAEIKNKCLQADA